MVNVRLLQQRTKDFELHNNVPPTKDKEEGRLDLGLKYNFHIEYAADTKHCKATLVQIAEAMDDPQIFHISATLEGVFETDSIVNDEMKKEIHIRCYYVLFPYAQALISQVSLATGITPIVIPSDRLLPENISIG